MKKNALLVLLLTVLTIVGLSFSQAQRASALYEDTPDDGAGYAATDQCGYVEGTSTPYHTYYIDADSMGDASQACADSSGYFYEYDFPTFSLYSDRTSKVYLKNGSKTYTVDLVDSVSGTYEAVVDQTTGRWSGYGYITDASYTGNRWLWFDWTCAGTGGACSSGPVNSIAYRVRTNLDTGAMSGYAWNDTLGFISFRNLTMELAPHDVVMYVDLLASDTELGPDDVDLDTAPLADAYDYWRIRVQFLDTTTGTFLDESDFNAGSFDLTPSTIGEVFLNQVEDSGTATVVSAVNESLGCTDSTVSYCSLTESDGSWSANTFIYSGAPTSDMTGLNTDSDVGIENHTDREGCRWIYHDQWYEVDNDAATAYQCPYASSIPYDRDTVFYDRSALRNMIGLETLAVDFAFSSSRTMTVSSADGAISKTDHPTYVTYTYQPDYTGDLDGDGINDGIYLSFKPRYTATKFVVNYDSTEYTQISTDVAEPMTLSTVATLRPTSDAFQYLYPTEVKPRFELNYQLEAESSVTPSTTNDLYFTIDTSDVGVVPDCGRRTDVLAAGTYGTSYSILPPASFAVGYTQKNVACQGTAPTTTTTTNTLSNPTIEQWVCDSAPSMRFNDPACYYTAYLNIVDRHAAAEEMKVLGAINSLLNDETVLTNTDDISILGSTETIKMRNKMYSQIVRYMLGESATGGTLNSAMEPSAGLVELMNQRLVVAEGDVLVDGSTVCSDKTLVVIGGNVYINGNITGCRLGVIAFEDNGVGGNVYVAPIVTDLYANFFIDGALYSYNGVSSYTAESDWANDEARVSTLLNQLYLNGSLVSRNTVNGSSDADGDGLYDLGDGTTTTDYDLAREHDLNMLRQYRLCYPLDAYGVPDTSATPVACGEGESLSSEYGDPTDYSSFILEYAPADNLPVFHTSSGFFN